jgi:hypothetical protein
MRFLGVSDVLLTAHTIVHGSAQWVTANGLQFIVYLNYKFTTMNVQSVLSSLPQVTVPQSRISPRHLTVTAVAVRVFKLSFMPPRTATPLRAGQEGD